MTTVSGHEGEKSLKARIRESKRVCLVTLPTAWGGAETNTLLLAESLLARGHVVTLVEIGPGFFSRRARPLPGLRIITISPTTRITSSVSSWIKMLREEHVQTVVLSKPWVHGRVPGLDLATRVRRLPYLCIEHHPAESDDGLQACRQRPSWGRALMLRCTLVTGWVRRLSRVGAATEIGHEHEGRLLEDLRTTSTNAQLSGVAFIPWRWRAALDRRRMVAAQRLERWARTDLICVSRTVQHALAQFEGQAATNAHVIHPGICITDFFHDADGRTRTRDKLGIPEKAMVIGSMGRLAADKRWDAALRLFAQVTARIPNSDLHFLLVGDGPEAVALRTLADSLGIGHRVHMTGFVKAEERRAFLSAMDTWLLVSETEGLSMGLIEAMACGCLVVAMDSGGPSEVLTDPRLGWLIRQDDWSSCVEALLDTLLLLPEERISRITAATRYVQERFSAERQNAKIAAVIEAAQAPSA